MARPIVGMLLGAALAASACTEEPAAIPPGEQRLRTASQGLCDAEVLASQGQVREAEQIFDSATHDYLHELARMLQEVDPAAAAELLEAKERVEAALLDPGDAEGTEELLVELERALQDAAQAADLPRTRCGPLAS